MKHHSYVLESELNGVNIEKREDAVKYINKCIEDSILYINTCDS